MELLAASYDDDSNTPKTDRNGEVEHIYLYGHDCGMFEKRFNSTAMLLDRIYKVIFVLNQVGK